MKSIALPLMGAGVGGLSVEESARSTPRAVELVNGPMEIHIYTLDPRVAAVLCDTLEKSGVGTARALVLPIA